jgi:hypothetical protein
MFGNVSGCTLAGSVLHSQRSQLESSHGHPFAAFLNIILLKLLSINKKCKPQLFLSVSFCNLKFLSSNTYAAISVLAILANCLSSSLFFLSSTCSCCCTSGISFPMTSASSRRSSRILSSFFVLKDVTARPTAEYAVGNKP